MQVIINYFKKQYMIVELTIRGNSIFFKNIGYKTY